MLPKVTHERILDCSVIILTLAFIIFAFVKSGNELWGLIPIGSILIVVLLCRQGKLAHLKFTKEGIEATMAKAHQVTEEAIEATIALKELMKETSAAILGLIKRSGRMGGYSYDEKEKIKQDVLTRLSEMGVSKDELDSIEKKSKWHDYTACDYAYHILQGRHFPSGNAFTPGPELNEANELRMSSPIATPDELESFLTKWNLLTPEAQELINDYRHYVEHHEQRRPEVWAQRDDWYKFINRVDEV